MIEDLSWPTYALVVLSTLYVMYSLGTGKATQLSHIPTVGGPSMPLLSYLGIWRTFWRGSDVIQEGYDKYQGGVFKYASLTQWIVVFPTPRILDDLQKSSTDALSLPHASNEILQREYTMSLEQVANPYHNSIVRTHLTRNLDRLLPDICDEIVVALNEEIPVNGEEWTAVPAMATMAQLGCRVLNRVFVGLPTCRDPDYCALQTHFVKWVTFSALLIEPFPTVLRPLVAYFVSPFDKTLRSEIEILEPIITERFRLQEQHGAHWADKPNDFLQWMIDGASEEERTVSLLCKRNLQINFSGIHSTSALLTHVLFKLAAHPQYVTILREEVEAVIAKEGWTKIGAQKMRKLDSFLKETARTQCHGKSLMRKVMRDVTLPDGTLLPAGTSVFAAMRPIHFDGSIYPDPHTFDPWRFANSGNEQNVTTTSLEFLAFGHGADACPGRFFAVYQIKMMLTHILTLYDVRLKEEGVAPPPLWIGTNMVPNQTAQVLFRKRQI